MNTVLITGAGGGLGLELVKEHLKQGDWQVFALPRRATPALAALAEAHGDRLEVLECDISSTAEVEAALTAVRRKTDLLHRLFNNAGIHRFADWVTLDRTELDFLPRMYDVNAVGPLRVVKASLPLIRAETVIVNISSEAASLTDQTAVIGYAYAMSKAAMNMGARIMDNWLAPRGTRTIMIHPGRMRTAMQGAHSNIDPWETSGSLMRLLARLGDIPRERLFMDYQGNPLNW